jgi:hypothetical protein
MFFYGLLITDTGSCTGSSNCPGKSLAMMELRSVIARTLHEFDVSFPEGTRLDLSFFKEVKDHFVAGVPKVDLVFTKRETS